MKMANRSDIILGDSLQDLKSQNFCSQDLIVVDPPFEWEPLQLIQWIDQAVRVCKPNGNIAIFNHPLKLIIQLAEINRRAYSTVEKYNIYKGLTLVDWITVEHNSAKTKTNSLATRTMAIALLTKDRANRKFYVNKEKKLTSVYDPESRNIITDHWIEKKHKPGHHGKFSALPVMKDKNFKHSTATAAWVIEKLLYCLVRPTDLVYDCFGGSGTVPYLCNEYGIQCRSVELNQWHYTMMQERLARKKTNRNFTKYASELLRKADELQGRTTNRLGTSLQGSTENRGEELERSETNGKMD